MPVQSTCPECGMTLTMSKGSGSLKCPICETVCSVPASRPAAAPRHLTQPVAVPSVPSVAAVPASNRRRLVLGVLVAMTGLWLGAGLLAGAYFLRGDKSSASRSPTAQTPAFTAPASVVVATQAIISPPPPPPPPPPVLTQEQKEINAAIDRGVAWLKPELKKAAAQRKPEVGAGAHYAAGSLGAMALMGLTLLECGVAEDDESLQQTAVAVRRAAPTLTHTYTIAVSILFLDRLGDKRDRDLLRSLALRLIAGQVGNGNWSYACPLLDTDDERALLDFLQVQESAGLKSTGTFDAETLPRRVRTVPVVRAALGKPLGKGGGDHSNAQFAILALWVARRHAVPVQPALALADRHFREAQADEGSWSYFDAAGNRRASMTCAGLLALAIGRSSGPKTDKDKDKKPEKDTAIEKGFRYLIQHIGPGVPRGRVSERGTFIFAESWGDLYYLWSLERVAMVYDLKIIGGKDWYAWASKAIVNAQKDDGSWRDAFTGQADTCFALLVLKRVNVVRDLTSEVKKAINLKDIAGE